VDMDCRMARWTCNQLRQVEREPIMAAVSISSADGALRRSIPEDSTADGYGGACPWVPGKSKAGWRAASSTLWWICACRNERKSTLRSPAPKVLGRIPGE
jgi:hypothetical protein